MVAAVTRLLEVTPGSFARPIELHDWDHKERMRFAGRDQRQAAKMLEWELARLGL